MTRDGQPERRDPAAGVLKLGSTLGDARRTRASGEVEVRDRGRIVRIELSSGAIRAVALDGRPSSVGAPALIQRAVSGLFAAPRPHVLWRPADLGGRWPGAIDPLHAVLDGVRGRSDAFDPRELVERIPVPTLELSPEALRALSRLPLADDEREFLARLRRPTPIPMLLWKRGLDPRRAGSLLVALNVLGVWHERWRAGDLPRLTPLMRLVRRVLAAPDDRAVLQLGPDADEREVDRALRRLSFELHPDRRAGLGPREAKMADESFRRVAEAHAALSRSRRRRPVRGADEDGQPLGRVQLVKRLVRGPEAMLAQALRARDAGDAGRARAFAIKGLALDPPPELKGPLLELCRLRVAG